MQNLPLKLYKAAQVRELDRIAIEEFGIPGIELMTRAGAEVFRLLLCSWPKLQSIAIFCGSGNNAGDGYVLGRLALAKSIRVRVFSVIDPEALMGDALLAYEQYCQAQGQVERFQTGLTFDADVIVDALLGTGLDRAVCGIFAEAIAAINNNPAPVLAIDIPSGLHADTGNVMGCAVMAAKTISFIGLKQGLFTGQAADYCGEMAYASLDIPEEVFSRITRSCKRVSRAAWSPRLHHSHKGSYGHVVVVGGDKGFSARPNWRALLRSGLELV